MSRIDMDAPNALDIGYEAGRIPTPHTDALIRRVVERVRGAFTVKQARAIRRELDWPVDPDAENLSDLDSALAAIDRFLGAVDSDELADAAEAFGIQRDQAARDDANEQAEIAEALRKLHAGELSDDEIAAYIGDGTFVEGVDVPVPDCTGWRADHIDR